MSKLRIRSNIAGRFFLMAAVSILVLTAVFLTLIFKYKSSEEAGAYADGSGEVIVALNEIDNLMGSESTAVQAKEKLNSLMDLLREQDISADNLSVLYLWIFYGVSVASIIIIFFAVYLIILKPFSKLEEFASEIAAGNLDIELRYERLHMFGKFTWAFDHMRKEIKRARQCEMEAIENNKTVIATLSHDIKTPIASIRAYSEALAGNPLEERRERYIAVIIRKCDEVAKITNDMFIHSLHDLDKLVIKKENVEIHKIIKETVYAMQGSMSDIVLGEIIECTLSECDGDRIVQVLENLINNARKYAPGNIYISSFICNENEFNDEKAYVIKIKDTGSGIADEDMPFIFNKFYRGKNHGNQSGSGLGLFIVKYIMEQMKGKVCIENHSDGMEVKLYFQTR